MNGVKPTDELKTALVKLVRSEIGAIATVDKTQFAPSLPKTRSGKIMRRILRKIAENDCDNLGDISTLAEPEVVDDCWLNAVHQRNIGINTLPFNIMWITNHCCLRHIFV
jgi:acetyl-CoA synthetase